MPLNADADQGSGVSERDFQKENKERVKRQETENDKEDKEIIAMKLLFYPGFSCMSHCQPTTDGKSCLMKRQCLTNPSPLAMEVSGIKLVLKKETKAAFLQCSQQPETQFDLLLS